MEDDAQDAQRKVLFSGEMQLAAWGESMQQGAWVKMWVHPEDLDAFKHMKARTGKTAGQRLGVVIVQIGDDEAIVEQNGQVPAPRPTTEQKRETGPTAAARATFRPHIGDLGMIAVRWCKDPDFQQWTADQMGVTPKFDEGQCKDFILEHCGVYARYGTQASRKHLDVDPECMEAFHRRIRIPYRDWLIEQGIQK